MGEPKYGHIEWSKLDRERKISVIFKNKWYKWSYLQNRNKLTDLENKLMVTSVGGKVGQQK